MPNPPGAGHDDSGLNLKYALLTRQAVNMTGLGANGVSLGGAPGGQIAELVAAAELNGLSMDTADEVYDIVDFNAADFDLAQDIHARLIYIDTAAAIDGSISWTIDMKGLAVGEAVGDAKATPDGTATFVNATTTATPNLVKATEWAALQVAGEMTADILTMYAVTLTSRGDAAADELMLIAVQFRGHRKITNDTGRQST
jgi:hypothetical protein